MTTSPSSTLAMHPDGRWITGTVDGLKVEALAFTEGSDYGMPQESRISKLWVATSGLPGTRTVLFNYDRGLDVKNIAPSVLNGIIAAVIAVVETPEFQAARS